MRLASPRSCCDVHVAPCVTWFLHPQKQGSCEACALFIHSPAAMDVPIPSGMTACTLSRFPPAFATPFLALGVAPFSCLRCATLFLPQVCHSFLASGVAPFSCLRCGTLFLPQVCLCHPCSCLRCGGPQTAAPPPSLMSASSKTSRTFSTWFLPRALQVRPPRARAWPERALCHMTPAWQQCMYLCLASGAHVMGGVMGCWTLCTNVLCTPAAPTPLTAIARLDHSDFPMFGRNAQPCCILFPCWLTSLTAVSPRVSQRVSCSQARLSAWHHTPPASGMQAQQCWLACACSQ